MVVGFHTAISPLEIFTREAVRVNGLTLRATDCNVRWPSNSCRARWQSERHSTRSDGHIPNAGTRVAGADAPTVVNKSQLRLLFNFSLGVSRVSTLRTTALAAATTLAMLAGGASAADRVDLHGRNIAQVNQQYKAVAARVGTAATRSDRHAEMLAMEPQSQLTVLQSARTATARATRATSRPSAAYRSSVSTWWSAKMPTATCARCSVAW